MPGRGQADRRIAGPVSPRSPTPFGMVDTYSMLFDGVNETILFGNIFAYDYTASLTLSVWFKTSSATNQSFLNKQNPASATPYRGYNFGIFGAAAAGAITFNMTNTSGTNYVSATTGSSGYTDGNWHHAVVVKGGGTGKLSHIRLYVDGVPQSSTGFGSADLLTATTIDASANFYIGSRQATDIWFNGSLDEIVLFGVDLPYASVVGLYNGGKPISPFNVHPTIYGWYRMGDETDTVATIYNRLPSVSTNGTPQNMEAGDIQAVVP